MWTWADVKSGDERCAFCSCDNQNVLEKHHRIPARFGGTDRNENLVTVCANCHSVLERTFNRNFWNRVKALNFDTDENTDGQTKLHQEPREPETDTESIEKSEEHPEPEPDLNELAKKLVHDGRVDDIKNVRNQIDKDLLLYEFDLSADDAKLLKKLINREVSRRDSKRESETRTVDTEELREKIRREERNKLIKSVYESSDFSMRDTANCFDLSQGYVCQIINEEL